MEVGGRTLRRGAHRWRDVSAWGRGLWQEEVEEAAPLLTAAWGAVSQSLPLVLERLTRSDDADREFRFVKSRRIYFSEKLTRRFISPSLILIQRKPMPAVTVFAARFFASRTSSARCFRQSYQRRRGS